MIGVLFTSFNKTSQFVLVSATAIAIPFVLGDVVVLIFCSIWYPRPVPNVGYGILATSLIFILLQAFWLLIGCLIVHRNLVRAGNRAHDHTQTTKVLNEMANIQPADT